jgi:23S rRNA (cytidine1920-2'-O)/16S rRNA (cytidine1409-2'-O)-methyltransferase
LAAPGGRLVALVKPQFELGPRKIGKGGVVRASVEEYRDLIDGLSASLARAGWAIDGVIASPILGGDGNKEFVLGATRKP